MARLYTDDTLFVVSGSAGTGFADTFTGRETTC